MPAFSHFFLKRLSARSKFSSSWIMTSDKFYFPPSWRLAAPAYVQIAKASPGNGMGQGNRLLALGGLRVAASLGFCRCVGGGAVLRRRRPLVGAPNYARSLCSLAGLLGRGLGRRLRPHPLRLPKKISMPPAPYSRLECRCKVSLTDPWTEVALERAERSSASPRLRGEGDPPEHNPSRGAVRRLRAAAIAPSAVTALYKGRCGCTHRRRQGSDQGDARTSGASERS
jgi:hypothetical protein